MSSDSSNNIYNQSYGDVNACYQTNQHSLSLHSELNQLKMTNMRQDTTDLSCPLHAGSYTTGENYQSNFSTMFHQSSSGDYQSNNHNNHSNHSTHSNHSNHSNHSSHSSHSSHSYNSIPSANAQAHHNEMQLPPPPPSYPFEFNTPNIGHESVINSNSYNQHQDIGVANNSVMTYGNGSSSNDFKTRTPQVQTYSKFPPIVRSSQDNFVTPKVIFIFKYLR